jgi:hypothetical protein
VYVGVIEFGGVLKHEEKMTTKDAVLLFRFICRPGMYISTQDKENTTSFITGYEMGSPTCNFTVLYESFIAKRFNTLENNSRWVGHVLQLSDQNSTKWMNTFRKTALDFLIHLKPEELAFELDHVLKTRISSLIDRIHPDGNPWFNNEWIDEWASLCCTKSTWFKQLWSDAEFEIIRSLDEIVQNSSVFSEGDSNKPSQEVVTLKDAFDQLINRP